MMRGGGRQRLAALLLLAVCPLAMLLMMRGVTGGRPRGPDDEGHAPDATVTTRDARIAELEAPMRRLTDRTDLSEGTCSAISPPPKTRPW